MVVFSQKIGKTDKIFQIWVLTMVFIGYIIKVHFN